MSNNERLRWLYSQLVGAGCLVTHQDHQGKVLVVKLGINSRGNEGKLSLPAGHREEGESPQQTITREVREETGFEKLQIDYAIGVYKSGSEPGKIGIIFKGTVFGVQRFQPNDEVVALMWEDPNKLLKDPARLRSSTKRALEDYIKDSKIPMEELEAQLEKVFSEV